MNRLLKIIFCSLLSTCIPLSIASASIQFNVELTYSDGLTPMDSSTLLGMFEAEEGALANGVIDDLELISWMFRFEGDFGAGNDFVDLSLADGDDLSFFFYEPGVGFSVFIEGVPEPNELIAVIWSAGDFVFDGYINADGDIIEQILTTEISANLSEVSPKVPEASTFVVWSLLGGSVMLVRCWRLLLKT